MAKDDNVLLMHDYKWLRAIHLDGRDHVMQIGSVTAGTVEGVKGRKSKKPVVRFRDGDLPEAFGSLPFAISKTDTNTLAAMFGTAASGMVGRWITIYPTTTELSGETVSCIRIRPKPAAPPTGKQSPPPAGDAREP